MKIVYVSPVGVLGGAEQCLLHVMESVQEENPKAELHLIVSSEGPLLERAKEDGIRTHLIDMPHSMAELGDSILHRRKSVRTVIGLAGRAASVLPPTSKYLVKLRNLLRRLRPDVIHSNGLKAHLLTAVARHRATRLVWHIHDFLAARPAMGRALRLAAHRADGAIAISDAVARDAAEVLPNLPITTVYNAIDVKRFSPGAADGARLDRLAGLPVANGQTIRVGLVATYARWKGHEVLLQAAARFKDKPIRCYIVGGPIYRTRGSQFSVEELRAEAAKLGIADRVGFIGFQEDTASIYRDLDVVVHASTSPEPFGLTIVESMACGRPTIVSGGGGAVELFRHDVDALGFEPGDDSALASTILRLANDPALRRRLSDAAVRTAQSRFCHQRLGGEMLRVYRQAINR